MEIRDPIHGSISVNAGEDSTIDSPFFQRLRQIKQMGFSDHGFPGATHTRYLHSIGAMYLAGLAFDSIFRNHAFRRPRLTQQFRQLVRVAALLHDIGHAPLSHCTEFAMPMVSELQIPVYRTGKQKDRRANHEDYTIKIISDSSLTPVIRRHFPDFSPLHVAALVEQSLPVDDEFFVDDGINYRTVLSQIISSELDVDRMDYLRRDSYFAGVGYGNYDCSWIFSHLTFHVTEQGNAHLALDPRAIYAFNDFLISRYHMFLMVYLHHKSVIFEEMLKKYFQSPDATYSIPAEVEAYVRVDDYHLFSHLRREARAGKQWAERLVKRSPYLLLRERHGHPREIDLTPYTKALEEMHLPYIGTSSTGNLSRYTKVGDKRRRGSAIYVLDASDAPFKRSARVRYLEECTDLFVRYEAERQISRLYVPPEYFTEAHDTLESMGLP